jgi:glycine reductase
MAFAANFKGLGEIVGTVVCGDNYMAEKQGEAVSEVMERIRALKPDLLITGPAFNAGRYGPACGAVCKAVQEEFHIPVIAGMYPENPGVSLYARDILVARTGLSAASMRDAIAAMSALLRKRAVGEPLGPAEEDGYFPTGVKKNMRVEKTGAARAVDMLLNVMAGKEVLTELPMPSFDYVPPAKPVTDLRNARLALVTEGGLVPRGNPDMLESSRATKYLRYELSGLKSLSGEAYQSVHGGYNNAFVNEAPNRLLPVDALRDLVEEGKVGEMAEYFYTTTGNGTSFENSRAFGKAIAEGLLRDKVQGVILTST